MAEDAVGLTTGEVAVGQLGLGRRQRFTYLFDYGDGHRFEVDLVAIVADSDTDGYPRLIASSRSRQYLTVSTVAT